MSKFALISLADIDFALLSAEWVNAVVKQKLRKFFARRTGDVPKLVDFYQVLGEQLEIIGRELRGSRLFLANLAELERAVKS